MRQQSHSSNPVLRPPVGFNNWNGNNQPGNAYPQPPGLPQNQYLPGQAPPAPLPKPPRKSKSKSKGHGTEGSSKKRSRAAPTYIPCEYQLLCITQIKVFTSFRASRRPTANDSNDRIRRQSRCNYVCWRCKPLHDQRPQQHDRPRRIGYRTCSTRAREVFSRSLLSAI